MFSPCMKIGFLGLHGNMVHDIRIEHVLPVKNCFSRAAWNLFDVGNQSLPTTLLASDIRCGLFQRYLEEGRPILIPALFGGG